MKKGLLSVLTAAAAVAVAAIAATNYIKKKSDSIADYLDYEPDDYYPEDDGEIIIEEIETIPPFPTEEETTEE